MKAAFLQSTGGPDVIEYGDLPDPTPGAADVIVKTEAVAVNPIDVYLRSGAVAAELPRPYVPGCDVAGTVVSVGDAVDQFQVGDRVWGSNQGWPGDRAHSANCAVCISSGCTRCRTMSIFDRPPLWH